MIIKKKYIESQINNLKEQEQIENEPAVDSSSENNVNNQPETVEAADSQTKDKLETEKIEEIKEKKDNDFNLNDTDIKFAPRAERREGTRRRGYRRTQDRNIVSRAQEDAQSIKEAAKQDGYKEGIASAKADIEQIKENFSEFYKYKDIVVEKVSECILDVSVEIAKKILNKEIQTDKTSIIHMIKGVVEEINKTENKIVLKVMPKDAQIVNESIPQIFSDGNFEAKITVIPDNNIKDGGVIVETSNGIVDATIESQMEIIKQALKGQTEKS